MPASSENLFKSFGNTDRWILSSRKPLEGKNIYTLRKDSYAAQPAKIRVAGETFANGPIVITFVPSFESEFTELLSLPPPPLPKTSTERKN